MAINVLDSDNVRLVAAAILRAAELAVALGQSLRSGQLKHVPRSCATSVLAEKTATRAMECGPMAWGG